MNHRRVKKIQELYQQGFSKSELMIMYGLSKWDASRALWGVKR